jgi:hypothetical protein
MEIPGDAVDEFSKLNCGTSTLAVGGAAGGKYGEEEPLNQTGNNSNTINLETMTGGAKINHAISANNTSEMLNNVK